MPKNPKLKKLHTQKYPKMNNKKKEKIYRLRRNEKKLKKRLKAISLSDTSKVPIAAKRNSQNP